VNEQGQLVAQLGQPRQRLLGDLLAHPSRWLPLDGGTVSVGRMSALSANELLLGLGLVAVLAVGSQLLARLLRLPAIVVLLPVGFLAGVLTKDVQPSYLLGPLYQPFVSVAVGVILFEAGLRLCFRDITRGSGSWWLGS
jgi:hypothetical protein